MKISSIVISTVLTGAIAAAPVTQAHAGGCDSGTKVLTDLWGEYDGVTKTLGCGLLMIASNGSVQSTPCIAVADKVQKVTEQMIAFWNKSVGKKWAALGPRRLALGEKHEGRIVSTGGRMFITASPIVEDTVDIVLEKKDGKGKTEVTVCTNYRDENAKAWTFVVDGGTQNKGKVFKKTLTGVKGRFLKIHLDGKSLTDTMQYELTATAR